ncbi:MAG: ATP-binding protein [Chloroflexi bacterium]|nr:ATP-binding protein [Chloroflexota bacterium]
MTQQLQLTPWRDAITPHPDVQAGRYHQAEFAADLAEVISGEAGKEYGDPVEFFRRTYLTNGMKSLLLSALERLKGDGTAPVIQLKTAFGGGKTHTMLALYYLVKEPEKAAQVPAVAELLKSSGADFRPSSRTGWDSP